MIFGIKLVGIASEKVNTWIGDLGWKEPISNDVTRGRFATEDINKAHQWCSVVRTQSPHCEYQVEEYNG